MYYPDEIVEEVRQRNDIVDVISSYVRLTRRGSNYFGLCPFHNEKTGSFSVTPSKQMYYCFGCHNGGNVITFIQKYENMSFPEAVRMLADRAGMKLPESTDKGALERENQRAQLLAINKEAGKYYYAQLRSAGGKRGLDYFRGRGLSDETMQRFGLGFARPSNDETYRYLKDKGFSDELLRLSGLFSFSESRGMTDKFWNRVIFPIMDTGQRIIGFGGRVMGDGEPKYLNSPETPIFDKSRNLYGLHIAKSSKAKNIIICEGYMDVIALHQAGFDQAVASLGTAFTSGHANLIARYARENVRQDEITRYKDILLCYDSDGAGVDAAKRALSILREAGLRAKVISMTPYKDPDEFIRGLGAEEFQKRIDEAENGFMYEIRMLENEYDLRDPSGKSSFIRDTVSRILRFDDPVERDNYIGLISYKYDVPKESLNEVAKKLAISGTQIKVSTKLTPTRNDRSEMSEASRLPQSRLLSWICENPEIYGIVSRYITADDFADSLYRQVAEMLFSQIEKGAPDPADIISKFSDEEEQRLIAEAFHQSVGELETPAMMGNALRELMINVKQLSLTRTDRPDNDFDTIIRLRSQLEELRTATIDLTDTASKRHND
ncbi:MAG: DNA primase [Lachnospiraceae bacterium]|nr:DNA primase [Lachnospiraceae bacterium]